MEDIRFLYEIIEDYKETSSIKKKNELFKEFTSSLWGSKNKRRTFTKTIRFKVKDSLLDTDVGKVLNTWSIVEYKGYKAICDSIEWYDLIRQKINNLYTRYFDDSVILNKEYINLLKTPYNLYYSVLKGNEIEANEITNKIDNAIYNARIEKEKFQKQKMNMSWEEYKKLIESILRKIFDSCTTIDEYEKKHGMPNYLLFNEFSTEDNFYIRYICKSLGYHMQNYQKEYYELKRGRNKKYTRCVECGKLIEKTNNRVLYCKDCKRKKQLEWNSNYKKKTRG